MAVLFVLSIAGIFHRALHLHPSKHKWDFVVKIRHLLPLTFFFSMGSTTSTAHRLEKRRALHLPHFDNKMVQSVSGVQILTIKSAQEIRINCQFIVFLLYELKKVP